MKRIFKTFLPLLCATVANAQRPVTGPSARITGNVEAGTFNGLKVFTPETYGANALDSNDDRSALQAACDAASANGGGIVFLSPGNYRITLLWDPTTTFDSGTKSKLNGHYGLEVPPKVAIYGSGIGVTTITGYTGTSDVAVGCLISPLGMRSAITAYSCGSFLVRDLTLQMNSTADDRSAILVSAVHSDGVVFQRVRFGAATHHGIDIDYNRGLTCLDCEFVGPHPGSGSTSASWLQFDAGLCGPASTHLSAVAAPNAVTTFDRCVFTRPNTDTLSVRDIDIGHGACNVDKLTFTRCSFTGRNNSTATAIVLVDTTSTASYFNNVTFDGCDFTVYASSGTEFNDFAIKASIATTSSGSLKNWTIKNCTFNGSANGFVHCGNGSGSSVTAALWQGFKGWKITDNTFNFDQTGMTSTGGTKTCLLAYGLNEATIRGNKVWSTGSEASVTTYYPYYLNDTSGVISENSSDQNGTCTGMIPFAFVTAGAETACQAATIPFWRVAFYGNSSRGNTNGGHYFFQGANGVDGGSSYNFQFWGNTFQGAGSYSLAYQYFASSANDPRVGGQTLYGYAAWDPTSISAGAEVTQTFTVTGARTTLGASSATATLSAALPTGVVIKQVWVSAADTVSVTLLNTNASAQDPANIGYRISVVQF